MNNVWYAISSQSYANGFQVSPPIPNIYQELGRAYYRGWDGTCHIFSIDRFKHYPGSYNNLLFKYSGKHYISKSVLSYTQQIIEPDMVYLYCEEVNLWEHRYEA